MIPEHLDAQHDLDALVNAFAKLAGRRPDQIREVMNAQASLSSLGREASFTRGEVERLRKEIRDLERTIDTERHEAAKAEDDFRRLLRQYQKGVAT